MRERAGAGVRGNNLYPSESDWLAPSCCTDNQPPIYETRINRVRCVRLVPRRWLPHSFAIAHVVLAAAA